MQEEVTLPGSGSIPGIGGVHGPGTYLIDWDARTITPVVAAVEAIQPPEPAPEPTPEVVPIAPVEEAAQPEPAPIEAQPADEQVG